MNKVLLFLMGIVFLCGCQDSSSVYVSSEKEKIVNEITNKVAVSLRNEFGLQSLGSGGQTADGIKMLALAFHCYRNIDIDEGRELLIHAIRIFTEIVNADERVHPYLASSPFNVKNVEIMIFIKNPDGTSPAQGKLSALTASKGVLKYDVYNPEIPHYKNILKETYEEALEKLKP